MTSVKNSGSHCWLCGPDRFALNRALDMAAEETRVGRWQHWDLAIDIAPLMVGHLLASPKRHLDLFIQLSLEETMELGQIFDWLSLNFAAEGKELVAFEYCGSGSARSQCVSHTHLHILPVRQDQQLALEAILTDKGTVANISNDPTCTYNSSFPPEHLFVFYRGKWKSVKDEGAAQRLRTDVEHLVAGTSKPWRDRLVDDEIGGREAIFRTMQKVATYV